MIFRYLHRRRCLEGNYKIEIDHKVEPVKLPKRSVPVTMMKPLKEGRAAFRTGGLLHRWRKDPDWISSLVIVKKPNGKLRICIDPIPLNKALKRSHFPLPTIDAFLLGFFKRKSIHSV